jgi:hypothetical protein
MGPQYWDHWDKFEMRHALQGLIALPRSREVTLKRGGRVRHRSFRAIARRHAERNERIGAVMGERPVFRRVVP